MHSRVDFLLAEKVYRIGKQSLWECRSNGRLFYRVSIINRTYYSSIEIPIEKARIWFKLLGGKGKFEEDN